MLTRGLGTRHLLMSVHAGRPDRGRGGGGPLSCTMPPAGTSGGRRTVAADVEWAPCIVLRTRVQHPSAYQLKNDIHFLVGHMSPWLVGSLRGQQHTCAPTWRPAPPPGCTRGTSRGRLHRLMCESRASSGARHCCGPDCNALDDALPKGKACHATLSRRRRSTGTPRHE